MAIDLPGFGHSQRRDALLSPRAMGEFIIRAATASFSGTPKTGTSGNYQVIIEAKNAAGTAAQSSP